MRSYKAALDRNEANSRAALRYGVSLHDQGDPMAACQYYYKALELDPRNKAAYNNLGQCRGKKRTHIDRHTHTHTDSVCLSVYPSTSVFPLTHSLPHSLTHTRQKAWPCRSWGRQTRR